MQIEEENERDQQKFLLPDEERQELISALKKKWEIVHRTYGVVLVNYFNYLVKNGISIKEAVMEGAIKRLRPVLMTASIAAFGLLPLLFATGPGSEIQRPLAIVVINGLVSSTLLTLIILPILYLKFSKKSDFEEEEIE